MKGHLFQIARTALLCGALGLLLNLGLAELARFPELTVPALGIFGAGCVAILLAQEIAGALRTGILPRLPGAIRRREEPIWFWGSLALSLLCLLLLLWLLVASLIRLVRHSAA